MPSGSCFCGNIKYSYDGEPVAKALCHCLDCRKMSGSTYSTNLVVPEEGFKILSGKPKTYTVKADSGESPTNFFCGDCGSTLWRETGTFAGKKVVKAGTLDNLDALDTAQPALELYAKHRVNWVAPIDGANQAQAMS